MIQTTSLAAATHLPYADPHPISLGPLTQPHPGTLATDEQRALELDLERASQVQRGLLPNSRVQFGEWNIGYQYKPAGLVGGDYCDLIPPTETSQNRSLTFVIADVAGKGIAASLLTSHLHATFRILAGMGLELDSILEVANRLFCESTTSGQYATLICGRISNNGVVEIASAGHLPALVISRDGVKKIDATGLPLGIFPASRYSVHRFQLEPGDSLLLYTDGISEARDLAGEEYGIDGLASAVSSRHGWSSDELVAACHEDIDRYSYGTRQADDQTLLAIQRSEPQAEPFKDSSPEVFAALAKICRFGCARKETRNATVNLAR